MMQYYIQSRGNKLQQQIFNAEAMTVKTNCFRRLATALNFRGAFPALLLVCATIYVLYLAYKASIWHYLPIINENMYSSVIMGWDNRALCPVISPLLIGWINISSVVPALSNDNGQFEMEMIKVGLKMGGRYEPKNCQSRHSKVAILIPFRNRTEHLAHFLRYMHPFLQRQQLNYAIFVIEQQNDGLPFNRGMLLNIGFKEALMKDSYQCFIFHDVDHLPEDDHNPYSCPEDGKPRQLAYSRSDGNYNPIARSFFGGVSAVTTKDYRQINGYSNSFWGWGGEDDDLFRRIRMNSLNVTRITDNLPTMMQAVRYKLLRHQQAHANPDRFKVLKANQDYNYTQSDGVNNVIYKIVNYNITLLNTHLVVDLRNSTSG